MVNIAKKKIPLPVVLIFVYLSYCAMSMYMMRGTLAYYSYRFALGSSIANDIAAFFLGGIIPFVLYQLFYWAGGRTLGYKTGGDTKSLLYGLNLSVILANLILFLLKFMYLAIPLYASIIDILINPIVTVGVVALYMLYAFKMEYVEKSRFRLVLIQVLGAFIAVYGVLAVINLITTVM